MTRRLASEISEISQHIDGLRQQLDTARQWWPAYLFHCTDIRNAVNILRQGELLSRNEATISGQLEQDIAAPNIIANTPQQFQDCVRLYFRPRTPTQYRNEGFRPSSQRELESHCPVPVYLIFDSRPILSRQDSLWTAGNAGTSGTIPSGDLAMLRQIPFELVYHVGSYNSGDRPEITYHRNAEVLVPQRLGLDSLRYIGCRSPAEYETLLYLLPPNTVSRWVGKIGVRPYLFNREWTFVERAELGRGSLILRFNRSTKTPGPFGVRVEIVDTSTGQTHNFSESGARCSNTLSIKLPNLSDYTVRGFLDDHIAYANRYQNDDLPF